jgi:epoxyqueuosine reductase
LGNALSRSLEPDVRRAMTEALARRADHPSAVVQEHVQWALQQSAQDT